MSVIRLAPQSVIFSALFFESFIYDYAAHNLTDPFVRNHLDKLDIISKWVIVPKILYGKEFPKDSKAFQGLKRIIRERNELVHAKSKPIRPFLAVSDALENSDEKFLKSKEAQEFRQHMLRDVEKLKTRICPFEAILEVLSELRKIEGECDISTQWWQLEGTK